MRSGDRWEMKIGGTLGVIRWLEGDCVISGGR